MRAAPRRAASAGLRAVEARAVAAGVEGRALGPVEADGAQSLVLDLAPRARRRLALPPLGHREVRDRSLRRRELALEAWAGKG